MEFNEKLDAALAALDGDMIDTLARWIRIPSVRAEQSAPNAPFGTEVLAYDLLLQEQFPSWLYSVRQGATTVWEHWDGINERGDMWSAEMNSFNHYAYGAVGEWLYRTVAGIREAAPGFGEILFCPVPDARLGWAEASLDTVHGVIRSAWRIAGDTVRYEVTVPEGTRAEIRLPGGTREALSAGSYVFAERLG